MIDYSVFKEECLLITYGDIFVYDLDLDPWELSYVLLYLNINGTNWSSDDFSIDGCKNYDEDGNSYVTGLLRINTKEKNLQDFLDLSERWEEVEADMAKTLAAE